jgi:hypothetical protein
MERSRRFFEGGFGLNAAAIDGVIVAPSPAPIRNSAPARYE